MPTFDRDDPSEDQDRDETARRAYRRFEERGGADGDDQADWYAAEREIRESRQTDETARFGEIRPDERTEESVTSGGATRGRGVEGAPWDEEKANASGTGPTATPTGNATDDNVRTPGTAVSGGPTETAR